jgi:hypothetical protein
MGFQIIYAKIEIHFSITQGLETTNNNKTKRKITQYLFD